ncbi:MAG: S53 family peptidase [Sciscionella sp.]
MRSPRLATALAGFGVAVASAAGFAPQAAAAPAATHPNTANVSAIAQQIRAGTLAATHGVHENCLIPLAGKLVHLGCQSKLVTTSRGSATPMTTATPAGYGPAELSAAYHLPDAASGSNNTIAIVGVGAYPNLESDLATYRSQYGLPACTTANGCLTITDYHGGPPLQPNAALSSVEESYATETALDVDMASASCPTCKITMVQIPMNLVKLLLAAQLQLPGALADDFGTAVNEAVNLGASSVSMSYGLPTGLQGGYLGTGAPAQALHHPGVAVVASSGDSGYTGNQQIWPQEVQWVTSAGGTTLTKTADGYTNTAWGGVYKKDGSWIGAGSGCATDLGPAVGQPAAVAANCKGHRAVSDVSADADPYTGVAVYDTYTPSSGTGGGWLVVGGTSAASPFLAGLYARAGNLAKVEGPNTMYAAPPGTIDDVTGGSNAQGGAAECTGDGYTAAVCTGAPGWDGPTGVGVPHGLGAF